jgi:hypothetical protein
MLVTFGGLGWLAARAPVVEAAGTPLYLHGTGTAPGCTPGTMSQTIGGRTPACHLANIGVWNFSNLPAQTVAAGVWSFTMYWTGGGATDSTTLIVSAGAVAGVSCAGFAATIPSGATTWTTTYGPGGAHKTSPFTVSTSGSQPALVIPAGGSLCLRVDVSQASGNNIDVLYDGGDGVANTRLVPPSIVVPESLLGLAAFALLIPVVTGRKRLLAIVNVRR